MTEDSKYVTCSICEIKHGSLSTIVAQLQTQMTGLDDKVDRKFDKLFYAILAAMGMVALNFGVALFQVLSKNG